jgi:hypothetical protein
MFAKTWKRRCRIIGPNVRKNLETSLSHYWEATVA